MNAITFEELDGLTGELLPERAVLSTVVPFNNSGDHGGDDGGAISHSACQSTNTLATGGLVGALGLSPNAQQTNLACTPAAVATH